MGCAEDDIPLKWTVASRGWAPGPKPRRAPHDQTSTWPHRPPRQPTHVGRHDLRRPHWPGKAYAIVDRALDAGINFIDTANVYSQGRSEELVGDALETLRRVSRSASWRWRGRW
ncbi:MAG TPA: aldo/keto reductase [Polyangiales bacterium]